MSKISNKTDLEEEIKRKISKFIKFKELVKRSNRYYISDENRKLFIDNAVNTVPILLKLTNDDDFNIRINALNALKIISFYKGLSVEEYIALAMNNNSDISKFNPLSPSVKKYDEIIIKKKIHSRNFLRFFLLDNLNSEETKFFDFKETYALWRSETKIQVDIDKFKIEICSDIAAFANSDGGIIIIGITNKTPREIKGVKDIENKKQQIHKLVNNLLDVQDTIIEVVDVDLVDKNKDKKTCLLIIIAQTKEVVGVKINQDTYRYPIRVSSAKEYRNYKQIKKQKNGIRKNNYHFINFLEVGNKYK